MIVDKKGNIWLGRRKNDDDLVNVSDGGETMMKRLETERRRIKEGGKENGGKNAAKRVNLGDPSGGNGMTEELIKSYYISEGDHKTMTIKAMSSVWKVTKGVM